MPTQITLKQLYERASTDNDLFEAVINGRTNVNAALASYDVSLSSHDASSLQEGLAVVVPAAIDFNDLPGALGGWGVWGGRVKILP